MKLTTTMLAAFDAQDVFDIVAWHLLWQNSRATAIDRVKCMYRAPDGKRCAIGWLIPDDVYSKALEFFGVRDIAQRLIEGEHARFARFLYLHMSLLRALQEMHDANLPAEWPVMLRAIAQRHSLNANAVTHCERTYGFASATQPEPKRPVAPISLLDTQVLLAQVKTRQPWSEPCL